MYLIMRFRTIAAYLRELRPAAALEPRNCTLDVSQILMELSGSFTEELWRPVPDSKKNDVARLAQTLEKAAFMVGGQPSACQGYITGVAAELDMIADQLAASGA